jgi:hypothetical protein
LFVDAEAEPDDAERLTAEGNTDETSVIGAPFSLAGFSLMTVHEATNTFTATLSCGNPEGGAGNVVVEHTKIIAMPVHSLSDNAAP